MKKKIPALSNKKSQTNFSNFTPTFWKKWKNTKKSFLEYYIFTRFNLSMTNMTIEAHQWLVPAVVLQLAALQQLGPAQQRREGPRLQHGEPAAANLQWQLVAS